MIDEVISAVFDTADHAGAAVRDLLMAKIPKGAIDQHAFRPGHDAAADNGMPEGSPTSVSVTVKRAHVIQVIEILENHNPVDLDEPALDYREGPVLVPGDGPALAPGHGPAFDDGWQEQAGDGRILQLAEKHLDVSKRSINRGGARVHRYVVETPVEWNVTLHGERVTVERHPVADGSRVGGAHFTDQTLEATAMAEEAVVAKTAHVREEVILRKEAVERVETVRDTVRREDVAIEQIPGSSAGSRK